MKLTATTVLEGIAETLGTQISPRLNDSFATEAVRMARSLITIVARASDDAVPIRVEENARMRTIFAKAEGIVADGDLASRLRAAARSTDPGLRISQLDVETGRLRLLLIELHCWLEDQTGLKAHPLDQEIWRAMRDFEKARAPRG